MLNVISEYLEMGAQIDTIYKDFEKAFGYVPHRRLISQVAYIRTARHYYKLDCDFYQRKV